MVVAALVLASGQAELPLQRLDWMAYERYAAPFAFVLGAVGVGALFASRDGVFAAAGLTAALGLFMLVARGGAPSGAVAVVNVPGSAGLASLFGHPSAPFDVLAIGRTAAAAGAAGALAIAALSRYRSALGVALALVLLLLVDVAGVRELRDYNRTFEPTATSVPRMLDGIPANYPVAYDLAALNGDHLNRYQMFEPDRRWLLFDSRLGETPRSGLVVAGPDWRDAARLDALPVTVELAPTQVLWRVGRVPAGVPRAPSWQLLLGDRLVPGGDWRVP